MVDDYVKIFLFSHLHACPILLSEQRRSLSPPKQLRSSWQFLQHSKRNSHTSTAFHPSLHHHPHHTLPLSQFTANHRRSALVPRELRSLRRRKRTDPTLAATLRIDSLAAASLSAVQCKIAIMMIRNTLQLSQQALVSVFVIGASHSLVVMCSEDNHSTSDTGRRTETIMCAAASSIASSRKSSPSTGERACHQSKSIFVHFFVINTRIKSTLKTTIQPIWIQTPFAPLRYSSLSAVARTRSFSLPKLPLSAS